MKIKQILLAASIMLVTLTIKAQASSTSLTVTTPTAGVGQTWTAGSSQNIEWTTPYTGSGSTATISLIPYSTSYCSTSGDTTTCSDSSPYIIASNVPNNGYYTSNIADDIYGNPIPAGQYLVNVYDNNNLGIPTAGNSSEIITIPPTSSTPGNFQLTPNSGPPGTIVTITGSGFASTINPSIQFGNGSYIMTTGSPSGGYLQFTVPAYSQPCSSVSYPATGTDTATTTTALGTCDIVSASLTPGTYNVTVAGTNGGSYVLPFTITSGSPASPSGLQYVSPGFSNGSLIQVSGSPTVYLVSNGEFVPFTSASEFLGQGYQWSQIQTVPQNQFNPELLSATPVGANNGAIIKTADNPTIYLITNGEKSGIPSMAIFNSLGLNLANLMIVSDQELQNYPSAPNQM